MKNIIFPMEKLLQHRVYFSPFITRMPPNSVHATAASTLISTATKDISILGSSPSLTKETTNCKHNQKATDWFLRTMSSLKKKKNIWNWRFWRRTGMILSNTGAIRLSNRLPREKCCEHQQQYYQDKPVNVTANIRCIQNASLNPFASVTSVACHKTGKP